MSIYSGFSNRQSEDNYNQLLVCMVQLLSQRVMSWIKDNEQDADVVWRFCQKYSRLEKRMKQLEERKYQPPKISHIIGDLSEKVYEILYGTTRHPIIKINNIEPSGVQRSQITIAQPFETFNVPELHINDLKSERRSIGRRKTDGLVIHDQQPQKPQMSYDRVQTTQTHRHPRSPQFMSLQKEAEQLVKSSRPAVKNPIIFSERGSNRRKRIRTQSDIRRGFILNF